MRLRAICAVVLTAAFLVRAVPCEAQPSTALQNHDCCDEGMCPDRIAAVPHHGHEQSGEPLCCLARESRPHQAQIPIRAASVSLDTTPSTLQVAFFVPAITRRHSGTPPPRARSAPLHLLYSVYLI